MPRKLGTARAICGVTRTRASGTERHISLRSDDLERLFPGLLDVLAAKKPVSA